MAIAESQRVTMLRSLWPDIQRAPKDIIASYRLAQSVLSSVSSNGNVFRRILKDVFLTSDNHIEKTASVYQIARWMMTMPTADTMFRYLEAKLDRTEHPIETIHSQFGLVRDSYDHRIAHIATRLESSFNRTASSPLITTNALHILLTSSASEIPKRRMLFPVAHEYTYINNDLDVKFSMYCIPLTGVSRDLLLTISTSFYYSDDPISLHAREVKYSYSLRDTSQ